MHFVVLLNKIFLPSNNLTLEVLNGASPQNVPTFLLMRPLVLLGYPINILKILIPRKRDYFLESKWARKYEIHALWRGRHGHEACNWLPAVRNALVNNKEKNL
jgi:hypothetical protein